MKSHQQLWFQLQDTSCQIGVTSLLVTFMGVRQELQKPQLIAAPRDQILKSSPGPTGQLLHVGEQLFRQNLWHFCRENCPLPLEFVVLLGVSGNVGMKEGFLGFLNSTNTGDCKACHTFNSCFTGEWKPLSSLSDSPPRVTPPAPTWADSSLSKKPQCQVSHSSKPSGMQIKIFQG